MLLDPACCQSQEAQDAVRGSVKSLREGIHLGDVLGRRCREAQCSPLPAAEEECTARKQFQELGK